MKLASKITKYLIYIAGMYIACAAQEWLFGTIFGVVGLSTILPETKDYSKYIVFTAVVYLLANLKIIHIVEIAYLLASYAIFLNYNFARDMVIKNIEKIAPYAITSACLISFQFKGLVTLIFILVLYIIYLVKKYDPRVLIGCAIILLTLSAYKLAIVKVIEANRTAIYSYYFLVLGVITELIYEIRYRKGCDNAID